MKKLIHILIAFVCATTSVASFADLTPVLAHKTKMENISKKIHALKQNIENNADKHETLMEELSKTESQIGLLNVSLQDISKKLAVLPNEIETLKKRIDSNEKFIKEQQSIFAKQIRQAYISGQQDFLKLLLQEETPERISRLTEYYRAIAEARREVITSIDEKNTTLQKDTKKINHEISHLEKLKAAQTNQKRALNDGKKYREVIIKQIQAELKTHQEELKQLEHDKNKLTQVIADLERNHRWDPHPRQPFGNMKGKLHVPTQGHVTKNFGEHILNSQLTYNGIFIENQSGAPIKAVYPGNVIFADWLRGFGLMIIVDHGNGYMSLYAHNESLYKHAGETVEADELIAKVGHTGGQTKPGLYFEIRHNGQALNPTPWLKSLV